MVDRYLGFAAASFDCKRSRLTTHVDSKSAAHNFSGVCAGCPGFLQLRMNEPCAREGAMSTAIPIADIGQKYPVTRCGLTIRLRTALISRSPEILFSRRITKMLKTLRLRSNCGLRHRKRAWPRRHHLDCWWFTPDTVSEADEEDCDVTLITVPSDRTTSGYLKQWVIDD